MYKKHFPLFIVSLMHLFLFNACEKEEEASFPLLRTESGFEYYHYIQNEGPKPQADEIAYFYTTQRVDDSLLINSRESGMISQLPIPKPLPNGHSFASPIMDAVKLMSIGDSLTIIVPIDSSSMLQQGFENFKNFYYDLVLIDIKSKEEHLRYHQEENKASSALFQQVDSLNKALLDQYLSGKLDENIVEKPSGLRYYIIEAGKGSLPEKGEVVQLRYYASVVDGSPFDAAVYASKTYPVKVGAGSVLAGWDEGLTYLRRGTKAILFIPSHLGYGQEGYGEPGAPPIVPPGAEIAYYIEVVK